MIWDLLMTFSVDCWGGFDCRCFGKLVLPSCLIISAMEFEVCGQQPPALGPQSRGPINILIPKGPR